jgi:hypothetical protein
MKNSQPVLIVRSLRDELGALTCGMSETFEETAEPA